MRCNTIVVFKRGDKMSSIDDWLGSVLAIHGDDAVLIIQFNDRKPHLLAAAGDIENLDRLQSYKANNYFG